MSKKKLCKSFYQVRIIGGKWKGRKISVFNCNELRPTMDSIKETLFNWLIPFIQKTRCLDCFAGSGSLAIEALSRYAAAATFIEIKRHAALQIKANLEKLGAKNSQVINHDILNYLSHKGSPYDIIFLDPPFRKNLLKNTSILLEQNGWLTKNCWIYIETEIENNLNILPKNWLIYRQKKVGQVAYCLYTRY
ncbi:Ribosomal RNA small subunit methyltransferase D [Candidatus Arsenophonus lipoptenae]|uniref:Ribosomal RNA small subunit methyltransferase D n=1 Tax=Candidatus Arsenophonus lipoptenae TaxID=634113 RepID=A0A0X9VEF4_9GAMM|nr:16S rRNA (guanine(966)-N(2))-methyltransferase RsmD [Candidatus Arsenophonus lipoptenae]AMA64989.1 Ribosomal RNA small subunit methyltransferase D [Candidatus Arsenophonus lipoptenae]